MQSVAMYQGEGIEPCLSSLSAHLVWQWAAWGSKAAVQFLAGVTVNTEQLGEPGAADKPDLLNMRQMLSCAMSSGYQARDAFSL